MLNDILDHEECPTLIDQVLILNNTSSRMCYFESPSYFKFLEHVESKIHLNNHVFYDYSLVLELNIIIKLSLIDPIQYEVSDLDEHRLITENLKYAGHHEFVDPYEQITTNVQLITMQSIGKIELIQEYLSSQSTLELHVTLQEKIHQLPLNSIPILQHSSHDFVDVIGENLELYFAQCFPPTINYQIFPQHAEYVKCGNKYICTDNEELQFQPMIMSSSHCLTSISGMNVVTHSETPSKITLHINFISEPRWVHHSLCNSMQQSYNDPCKFYDRNRILVGGILHVHMHHEP
jgi:hypothetical protein